MLYKSRNLRYGQRFLTYVLLVLLITIVGTVFGRTAIPKAEAVGTQLSFTVFLHGIGKGGDSASGAGQGNMDPKTKQRVVSVGIFNAQNALVAARSVPVTYNTSTGAFTGSADFGALQTGPYTITVRADQYLQKAVDGIQTITSGSSKQIPAVSLISGDMLIDNKIDIQDYNALMGCYSDLFPPKSCTSLQRALTDITDDGFVNQNDYNLFIREISNRSGSANPTPGVTLVP